MRFKFPFNLINKSKMKCLTCQSIMALFFKSWYRSGLPNQGFRSCFADGLKKFRLWGRLKCATFAIFTCKSSHYQSTASIQTWGPLQAVHPPTQTDHHSDNSHHWLEVSTLKTAVFPVRYLYKQRWAKTAFWQPTVSTFLNLKVPTVKFRK